MKTLFKPLIGVDYSMSSPALCLRTYDDHCHIWYINANKDLCTEFWINGFHIKGIHYDHGNVTDAPKKAHRVKHTEIQRFLTLAQLFSEVVPNADEFTELEHPVAVFESYSFGSKGRLAQIGENTGIMKGALTSKGYSIETIPPQSVKRIATGSGKALKEDMADAWFKRFGFYVHDQIGCEKHASPASDIVDSFFVLDTYQQFKSEK